MTNIKKAELILRIGIFGTFVGHGVFALLVKQSWIVYFNAVGISDNTAVTLLPLVGLLDIVVATIVLFRPIRLVLVWAVFWGFVTALIRPIAGEPIWDFVERSSNWAAPLALLLVYGLPKDIKDFFRVYPFN